MKWLLNRNTAAKLMFAFSVVLLLAIVIGTVGLYQAGQIRADGAEIGDAWLPRVELLTDMRGMLWQRRALEMQLIDVGADTAEVQRLTDRIDSVETAFQAGLKEYEPDIAVDSERRAFDDASQQWKEYVTEGRRSADLARAGRTEEARAVATGAAKQQMDEAEAALGRIIEVNTNNTATTLNLAAQQYSSARLWIIGVLLAALLAGIILALAISRAIAGPLGKAVEALDRVADGDLTARLDLVSKDEVGRMAGALNRALEAMRSALRDVRDSADTTSSSAQQLQAASEEISAGAQEQATSLEETAASLEEMTASVRQNSDHAQQADQLAANAREVAERGGKVVVEAVGAMAEINDASRQIADIISTIDEIAFQTNILALNAAVEAARAGQQGRGFAVVAGEVRTLAQRSASAAKEIKALIQNSSHKVEVGRDLVHRSGESLQDIVTAVKRVSDIVGDMAAASREQASGIDQVNRAITQMDSVTQANATQTEELASTAEALASQAEQLQALVGRFTVDEGERPVMRRAAAARVSGALTHIAAHHDVAHVASVRALHPRGLGLHLPTHPMAPAHATAPARSTPPDQATAQAPARRESALAGNNGSDGAAQQPADEPLAGLDEYQEY